MINSIYLVSSGKAFNPLAKIQKARVAQHLNLAYSAENFLTVDAEYQLYTKIILQWKI